MCSSLFHTLGFLNLNGYPVSHRSASWDSRAEEQCLFFHPASFQQLTHVPQKLCSEIQIRRYTAHCLANVVP